MTTRARILAQTLNRTRGEDDPEKKARLLERALETLSVDEALRYLPETKKSLDELLIQYAPSRHAEDADAVLPVPEEPESKLGEVYELGPHRLMCGDATNPEHVQTLLGGARPCCSRLIRRTASSWIWSGATAPGTTLRPHLRPPLTCGKRVTGTPLSLATPAPTGRRRTTSFLA